MKKQFLLVIILIAFSFSAAAGRIAAFPGAEGGGKYTSGGRGGSIYYVTNLSDENTGDVSTHEGSLRWCINQSGPRTIIFKVSGIIYLNSNLNIRNGDVTIAGQTAPGDGICLANWSTVVGADNVIIRYMRFRPGGTVENDGIDALWGRYNKNVIIDHCSMSWSVDECSSFYSNENFTMQWCLLAQSLTSSGHSKGTHGYGGIWGGENASFHHNMLVDHDSRNPRFNGWKRSGLGYNTSIDEERLDYRNNVLYNWGSNSCYGGEGGHYNMVNNYYEPGPATKSDTRLVQMDVDKNSGGILSEDETHGVYYIKGNYFYGNSSITNDNTKGILNKTHLSLSKCLTNEPFACYDIPLHTALNAYDKVLEYAGASLVRDRVDSVVVSDTRNHTYSYVGSKTGYKGLIDTIADCGGYPEYKSAEYPVDSNNDGIPDDYNDIIGFDPSENDINDTNAFGYTYLECYLNAIVAGITSSEYTDTITSVVSVPEVPYDNGISICYNGKEKLAVSSGTGILQMSVYSLTGILVKSYNAGEVSSYCINLSDLPRGINILVVYLKNGNSIKRKILCK